MLATIPQKLATLRTYVNISKRSVMVEGVASIDQRDGGGSRGLSGLFSRDKGHEGTEYLFHEKRILISRKNCLFSLMLLTKAFIVLSI